MSGTSWVHRGFEAFAAGNFEDGGSNLYVNAKGIIETIHRTDVDNDGYVDIVLPNAQGYNERGPTWIYKPGPGDGSAWERRELPTDSGDMCRIVDLDDDGYQDLVVVNSTNGVSCELLCHIYWGGPGGLTGERTDLPTVGAYDVAAVDVNGDGRLDLVFPSAWVDHHNPGRPLPLHVYLQGPDRRFEDVGREYGLTGIGARSVAASDLNGDGHVDLVVANYRHEFEYRIDSYLYRGTADGFDPTPQGLPTDTATQVFLADFNGDGWQEILFCGNNKVLIYWNDEGRFSRDNRLVVETEGLSGEFHLGALYATAADVDGDGRDELIVATIRGIEIRGADDLTEVRQFLPLKFAHWAHAADLDGDGRPELIASKYQEDETFNTRSAIFWNGPDGYSPERCSRVATMGAEGVTAGDLDGDGKPVIVFCNTMTGHAKTSPTLPSYIYFGGPGADYGVHRRQELPVGGECGDCAVADLDLDGWNDLVFGKMTGVRVFPGGPDGFRPERHYDLPCFLPCVQVADFNRDGYLDILALSHTYDDKPETFANSSRIFWGSAEGFRADRYDIFPTFCGATGYLADLTRNGYLDVMVGDKRGYVLIYLGGPDGYSLERTQRIPMWKDWKGGVNTAADLNGNGWLDLVVSSSGHYHREPDTLTIFYGGPDGYGWHHAQDYKGGFSPGQMSVADLNNNGLLDLIVPAYSTDLTRVVPIQIFWNRGDRFDLEHPLELHADAGFEALPIDLNRNGWTDLFVACHRNDVGHVVDSQIFWNGPDGLSNDRTTPLPGMGPHRLNARLPGNAYTRAPIERYTSPPHDTGSRRPVRIGWDAEVRDTTALQFEVRCAEREELLEQAPWMGPGGQGTMFERPGSAIPDLWPSTRFVQYRATFTSLYGCRSPRLREVRIDFRD